MLFIYYLSKPVAWIIPWILQAIVYYRLLRKMEIEPRWAIVPFLAEGKMSKHLFRHKSVHLHFLILTAITLGGGFYLRYTRGGFQAKIIGLIFTLVAMLIYGTFLIILYWRICKCFNKGFFFKIGTILFPLIFLFILGNRDQIFWGFPEFQPIIRSWPLRLLFGLGYEAIFFSIAGGVLFLVTTLSTALYPPRFMVDLKLTEKMQKIEGLVGDGRVVSRKDMMGDAYASLNNTYKGRDFYFDHKNDKDVVVLEYIIGSNLEDNQGLASYNILQMKDATRKGSALKFVIEAGGSYRWFTKGIKDETVGRYEIANGDLKKVADVDNTTSMSEGEELYKFLAWAKENYPADRYMLVFWDHGGGLSSGFGSDDLNKRPEGSGDTMLVNEIVDAIEKSGMKFDMIGFDACLMQDIEIAKVLEPYADYYMASEETESGDGWYYTSAFGMLAEDPTTSTEDFGKELISSFDLYNAISHNGEAQSDTTLSLLDLTRVDAAYDALEQLYELQDAAIRDRSADYGDISLAASNSYAFAGTEQIDLIDYLEKLDGSDYDDSILASDQIDELINKVRSTIVYRNFVSNLGINGLAVTFPYDSLSTYGKEHTQYEALGLDKTKSFYDDYFSIMAFMKSKDSTPTMLFGIPIEPMDYTKEEWYVEGFENYAEIPSIIDIPMVKTEDGYRLELSDSAWEIVSDSKLVMYQKTGDNWRYLGEDVPGALDENDHPMASTDGTWIHIGNSLVCYEAQMPVETEMGVIYKGTVKARLNGKDDILLQIEWEPISEDTPREITGRVKGYTFLDDTEAHREKGIQELSPGDSLRFLFDIYDANGEFVETQLYGQSVRVTKMENLIVSDKPLGVCEVRYGIHLKDIFQRDFVTDMIDTALPQQ